MKRWICILGLVVVAGSRCEAAVGGGGVGGTAGGSGDALNGVPAGGGSGEVLAKASGTDYDLEWVTAGAGDVTGVTAGTGLGGGGASGELTLNITDAELVALLGLTSAANKLPYWTGSGTAANLDFSADAQTLVAGANFAAMRTSLGLAIGTNVQAYDATLDTLAALDADATAVTFLETAFTDGQMAYSASGNWTAFATSASGRTVMNASALTAEGLGLTNGDVIDDWGGKALPTSTVVGTTDAQTLEAKTLQAGTLTGVTTQSGIMATPTYVVPNVADVATVDVTKSMGTLAVGADTEIELSAAMTPGSVTGVRVSETGSSARAITIPSSYDPNTGDTRTSFTLAADDVREIYFGWDGAALTVYNLPFSELDLTELGTAPASDDLFTIWDTSAGGPKAVAYGDISTGGGTDSNAIHVASSAEISGITAKATPVAADYLVIEDSAASDAKKSATIGSLEPALEGVMDLQDMQGAVTDAQVPNTITVDAATLAATVTVVDGTDATSFPAIFDSATGSLAVKTDAALTYNASTGALGATSYSGNSLTSATGQALALASLDSNANITLTPHGTGQIRLAPTSGGVRLPSTATGGLQIYNTSDEVTNYERLEMLFASNVAHLRVVNGGSGTARDFQITGDGNSYVYLAAAAAGGGSMQFSNVGTSGVAGQIGFLFKNFGSSATSGTNVALSLTPAYNQASGTAANTDLLINRTETAVGGGAQRLFDAQVGGTSRFYIENDGDTVLASTTAASSTTTGALVVAGGVGVGGSLYTAGAIDAIGAIGSNSSTVESKRNNIVTTSTDGLISRNAVAATAGVPVQYSPRLRFTGQGWKTDATAASQAVNFIAEVRPVQGTSAPTGIWVIASDINGGGYTDRLTLTSAGSMAVSGSFTSASSIIAGVGSNYSWNGRARMRSSGDGIIDLTNNDTTDFNRLQFGGTTSSFPALKRNATGLEVRLADDSAAAPLAASQLRIAPRILPLTIESPSSSEDVSWFYTDVAITITKVVAVNVGTTPSVTYTVRQGTDRSATGTEVVTGGSTTTSTTTGDIVTSFNDATIPANSFIWVETTAASGTIASMNLTLKYYED